MRSTTFAPQFAPARPRRTTLHALLGAALAGVALAGCGDDQAVTDPSVGETVALDRGGAGTHRIYGAPVTLGQARARTYVVIDQKDAGAPIEVGVAFDERAMDGLPAAGSGHAGGHDHVHTMNLALPAQNPTPYKFVELNWNPAGHEPEGVYTIPHFDFHFYTITQGERDAILPSDPRFAEKSANLPAVPYRAPFYAALAAPGQAPMAVPMMGVHWSDVRSPELQGMLGKPQDYRPFTKTFIYGSWDGQFIFAEPMITRATIVAKKTTLIPSERDEVIPVSTAAQVATPGSYPGAYRIQWDAQAKEYRIGLTQMARR